MRHKIKVYSVHWPELRGPSKRLWYTVCTGCHWQASHPVPWPDGAWRYARTTWDAAFALGVGHLRQECKHV